MQKHKWSRTCFLWRWLHDCDWRRWGVACPIAVISMRCLLGARSGKASPHGARAELLQRRGRGGSLLRSGQLSSDLTRRSWRTPQPHHWLMFLDLSSFTPPPLFIQPLSLQARPHQIVPGLCLSEVPDILSSSWGGNGLNPKYFISEH